MTNPALARPSVVVVGLDCATGLQSARILARHGIPVIGLVADARHPCSRTNVCKRIVVTDLEGMGLIETLGLLAKDLAQRAVLLPCTDLSVLLISRWRNQLIASYAIALPPHDVVELLVDKAGFYDYAQRTGLPVPTTFFIRNRADAEYAAFALHYPAVVKPAVKTTEWKKHSTEKAYKVFTRNELLALYNRCATWSNVLIAQEWIDGGNGSNYTCNCYLDAASRPLVAFTSRKLRQWPLGAGEGSLSEECRDDAVERTTIQLFQRARHQGLGYLEMKRDARTGELLIVEPNVGRPTGRSAAAEAGGVSLLYTMYCDVLGLPLPENRQQQYRGGKWIHLRRDFQSAVHQWRRGELGFMEWARSLRGVNADALFSWRDPLPFLLDAGRVVGDVATARRGGSAHQTRVNALAAVQRREHSIHA
jgi:D-aspartate ligase